MPQYRDAPRDPLSKTFSAVSMQRVVAALRSQATASSMKRPREEEGEMPEGEEEGGRVPGPPPDLAVECATAYLKTHLAGTTGAATTAGSGTDAVPPTGVPPAYTAFTSPLLEDEVYRNKLAAAHIRRTSDCHAMEEDSNSMCRTIKLYTPRRGARQRSGVYGVVWSAVIDEMFFSPPSTSTSPPPKWPIDMQPEDLEFVEMLADWKRAATAALLTEPAPPPTLTAAHLIWAAPPIPPPGVVERVNHVGCTSSLTQARRQLLVSGVQRWVVMRRVELHFPREAATMTLARPFTVYALKGFKKEPAHEFPYGLRSYFLREVDLAMRLRHPNVVEGIEVAMRSDYSPVPASASGSSAATLASPPSGSVKEDGSVAPAEAAVAAPISAGNSLEVASGNAQPDQHFLIMAYCSHSLKDYTSTHFFYLSSRNPDPAAAALAQLSRVKNILYQVLQGVAFLHQHHILHRDLKPSNVLLNHEGEVKLCDLGLSTFFSEGQALSLTVVTLWYRAPEVLFEFKNYSTPIDMWSVGCILAEMLLGRPLFVAEDECTAQMTEGGAGGNGRGGWRAGGGEHQHRVAGGGGADSAARREEEERCHLGRICDVLGIPNDENFPGIYNAVGVKQRFRALSSWNEEDRLEEVLRRSQRPVATRFLTSAGEQKSAGLDLLSRMLMWNPRDRISAAEALQHPFFVSEAPAPCAREQLLLPLPGASTQSPPPTTTTTTTAATTTTTSASAA